MVANVFVVGHAGELTAATLSHVKRLLNY